MSQHFGNSKAREYLTLAGGDLVDQIRSGGKGLSPEYRQAITEGDNIGAEKRFFHWDLEFPEAFVDLERSTWKRREDQGFDAVVGNPPYDVLATKELGYDSSPYLNYFRSMPVYIQAARGKINLYKLFICRAIPLTSLSGGLSFITPMALLGDEQARDVRQMILTTSGLVAVESFPQKDNPLKRVFLEAKLSTVVFVTRGRYSGLPFSVRTHPYGFLDSRTPALKMRPDQISAFDPENMPILSCTQRDWDLATRLLDSNIVRMSTLATHHQGEVNETTHARFLSENKEGA